ncbi:MAG TPA: hypothetical protein VF115_05955 [Acidimicrobiia bacterium]
MISLFTYEDAKRLTEERQRRALAAYEARRITPNDSYVPSKTRDAEVIELTFGTACTPDTIGA